MEKDIRLFDLNIHYDETGPDDAPAVILLHGWGCRWSTVASIANVLNKKMKVYNLDLPGHGDSDEPNTVWGVEEYTLLVEEFIRAKGIQNPVLIGHSFGGRISILLSSRNDVDKVVLVDSAGIKPRHKLGWYVKVYTFKTLRKVFRVLPFSLPGKMVRKVRSWFGSSDYNAASSKMKAILSKVVNEDLKYRMPSIKAPTLLIWGEDDTATPLADAKIMERLIPDAGLVSFKGCGHYSFLDNPLQFKAVLQSFLLN